jgi:hypothetical protein
MILSTQAIYLPQYFDAAWVYDCMNMDGEGGTLSNFSGVATQNDLSWNARNLSQSTGGLRPTYRVRTFNTAQNSIIFDGNRWLTGSNISYAGEMTIIFLGNIEVASATRYFVSYGTDGVCFGAGSATFRKLQFIVNSSDILTTSADQFSGTTYAVMTAVLKNEGGNWSVDFYKNGVFIENIASTSGPDASADQFFIGARAASTDAWIGGIALIAGWHRVLTSWELNMMHQVFKVRGNIT